jgi:hypothetical protein
MPNNKPRIPQISWAWPKFMGKLSQELGGKSLEFSYNFGKTSQQSMLFSTPRYTTGLYSFIPDRHELCACKLARCQNDSGESDSLSYGSVE